MLLALESDTTAFSSPFDEYNKKNDFWWDSYLHQYIRTDNAKLLVAQQDSQIIGMIGIVFNIPKRLNHVANIYWFYVKKDFRGGGIGKKLIEEALKEIQNRKSIRKISLTVTSNQTPAIKLYEQYGFKIVGTEKEHLNIDGTFYDFHMMEKFIS